jgi:phenylalanyl-tRNA synthetase beta chain
MREEISIRLNPPQADLKAIELIRASLVASGHYEALTFSWVTDKLRDDFRPPEAAGLLRADESVRKDDAHLRPSMLGGLLEAVRYNQTVGNARARLFEIGSTFWTTADGKIDERRRLGIVGGSELRELRGAVESMLQALDARRDVKVVPDQRPGFAKSACGRIEWGRQPIGWLGKIDRAVAAKLDLTEIPTAAEIELAPLLAGLNRAPQIGELAKQPAVRRDLSLVVTEKVRYEQIESIVRELKLPWLEELRYVTTWRGKQIGEGNKSVTIELVFRADRTLVSAEVEEAVAKVVAAAKDRIGATLRT